MTTWMIIGIAILALVVGLTVLNANTLKKSAQ